MKKCKTNIFWVIFIEAKHYFINYFVQTPTLLSFHNYLKSREDFTEKLITRFKFF